MGPAAQKRESSQQELRLENRAFCTTRAALLRCIRKYCGEVNPTALEALITLSDNHIETSLRDSLDFRSGLRFAPTHRKLQRWRISV